MNKTNNAMNKDIILAVNPRWMKQILEGTKTCEVRRKVPVSGIDTIYLYETFPTSRIVGECKPNGINRHQAGALPFLGDITLEELNEYTKGEECWYIYLKDVIKYEEPKTLWSIGIFKAPHNFCYVNKQ